MYVVRSVSEQVPFIVTQGVPVITWFFVDLHFAGDTVTVVISALNPNDNFSSQLCTICSRRLLTKVDAIAEVTCTRKEHASI